MIGQRSGIRTCIAELPRRRGEAWVRVLCDCGVVRDAPERSFLRSLSCGCEKGKNISAAKRRHGQRHKPIYYIWSGMLSRCLNPKNNSYERYGAKGITVCSRWLLFENFYTDMGDPPSAAHQIDRYPDNNGNYEPENCRWATRIEQARNKSSTTSLTYQGQTRLLPEWAEALGINADTLRDRRRRGYSVERILTVGDLRSMRSGALT